MSKKEKSEITLQHVDEIYEIVKQNYKESEKISSELNKIKDLNSNSAQHFSNAALAMIKGEKYDYSISKLGTEKLIEYISRDFKEVKNIKKNILFALRSQINYRKTKGNPTYFTRKGYLNLSKKHNILIYGAPGTGKSYMVEEEAKLCFVDKNVERITFHSDYSYSQFVGCYRPLNKNNNIKYEFTPGPFLKLLFKALDVEYKNKNKPKEKQDDKVFLVLIEEINRANVASVFGDIFQLLDREDTGRSKYSISISEDIKSYIKKYKKSLESFLKDNKLYLPENFYIWATMNTSDQGVNVLDSAFKRRFDEYKFIGINDNDYIIDKYVVNINGIKSQVTWNNFRKILNSFLLKKGIKEDKLIGPFFIKPEILKNKKEFETVFFNKLVMYLLEDVLKYKHNFLFRYELLSQIKSFYYKKECIFSKQFLEYLNLKFEEKIYE